MKTVRDACQLQDNALSIKLSDQIEQLDELITGEGEGAAFLEKTYITQGMQDLISEGIARLAGVSSQAVFHLKQAMGGGKTHLLVGFGLLAKHPELRKTYCAGMGAASAFTTANIAAFNGRNNPDHFFWGEIAEQLGKGDQFKTFWTSGPKAPDERDWIELFEGDQPVLILLDEMPPYFHYLDTQKVGNGTVADIATRAFANLLTAAGKKKNVCVVVSDLAAAYESGGRLINRALEDARSEVGRQERTITPVDLTANEIYDILRKRLFKLLPDKDEIGDIADIFGRKLEEAAKSKTANRGAEAIADEIAATYPFHPRLKNVIALFKENEQFKQTRGLIELVSRLLRSVWGRQANDVFLIGAQHFGSEGEYVMTPPPTGPLNPSGPNDTKDAWDTIDWLVKNVPESNGKVGMLGSSYEGFTVVMALIHPHPALKVAAPESPMVDGWMGDDWFHYGAFRQINLDYFTEQTTARGSGPAIPRLAYDDYANFLQQGSAGDFARYGGLEQLPFWRKIEENPAYDAFWQEQALDKIMAKTPLKVPVMWLQGLWDQEDMWGAIHCYEAVEPKDKNNDANYLVMGPWRHSQVNYEGYSLGALRWDGNTALQFRRDVLLPFFNQYLLDGAPKANTPPVFIYNTGENHWDRLDSWPLSCDKGCANEAKPLYLLAQGKLSFSAPDAQTTKYDEYVSDPAKPVPFSPRPFYEADEDAWRTWLVRDQRFVDGRQDVLTYETDPLSKPIRVSGRPEVNLVASTSGTDSDWVVKLIDVFPPTVPSNPTMGGYELPISLDIFRGRYRTSFDHPEAVTPDKPLLYQFGLPTVNHVFLPGHRIMVQVQSTLFPLYDRNPQTFVPNIFNARSADYRGATQRIWHTQGDASFISLPIASAQ